LAALFAGASAWLCLASTLACVNAIQLVRPRFLAGSEFWSFGRALAVSETAFLYGFALPAAFGIILWLVARLGKAALAGREFALIGSIFWNVGVATGVGGVWAGNGLPFEGFALPHMAVPILFSAFIPIAGCALATFCRRQTNSHVSQWFALAAMGWFGWSFLTVCLFLFFVPVRGILQPLIASWFVQNLHAIVFGFTGLACVLFFVPKRLGRSLDNRALAWFGLWTLALFGGFGTWACLHALPAWLSAVATAGTVLGVIPLMAIGVVLARTARGKTGELDANPALRFCVVGLVFWLIANVQSIAGAFPAAGTLTDFTLFWTARDTALSRGFFLLIVMGTTDWLMPAVFGGGKAFSRLVSVPLWCVFAGAALCYISRLVAGAAQGWFLCDAALPFNVVSSMRIPPLVFSAIGEGLIWIGTLAFALDIARFLFVSARQSVSLPETESAIASGPAPEQSNGSLRGALLFLGLFLSLSLSWMMCVALPILQFNALGQAPTTGSDSQLFPSSRPGLAQQGAEVYRANGCAACHTQLVRPAESGADLERGWGKRRSTARDFILDNPAMPGTLRLGPDLANVGSRQNADAFLKRLLGPSASARSSRMPPFSYLFDVGGDGVARPRPEALFLAAYLQSLRSDGILYETPQNKNVAIEASTALPAVQPGASAPAP
jgi:cbb3-type cytochrome oxidase subunit 1